MNRKTSRARAFEKSLAQYSARKLDHSSPFSLHDAFLEFARSTPEEATAVLQATETAIDPVEDEYLRTRLDRAAKDLSRGHGLSLHLLDPADKRSHNYIATRAILGANFAPAAKNSMLDQHLADASHFTLVLEDDGVVVGAVITTGSAKQLSVHFLAVEPKQV